MAKRQREILAAMSFGDSLKPFQKITNYEKPKEVSWFSFDEERSLHLGCRRSLGMLVPGAFQPKDLLPLDMNPGYPDDYVVRDPTPERLDALLACLRSSPHKPQGGFVTWRGIITKLVTTPYAPNDGWELGATLRDGIIYLEEHESLQKQSSKFGADKKQRLFTYYGYKAETLLTQARTGQSHDSPKTTNTNVQFCSVFKSKLGAHSLVLGGEVDCILREPANDDFQKEYLEIKTNRVITGARQHQNFVRFKLLKTWAQSFLAGVGKVLFAFRDDAGVIQDLKFYEVAQFPRMARQEQLWDPNVCLTFANKVLDMIKANVTIDDANTVYTIAYHPEDREIVISDPIRSNKDLVFVRD
ncbi:Dom-3 Z [Kappamyces sp. JEL0829]|nr:Dom-3 Z [Kappamyces sp. JEL0829]